MSTITREQAELKAFITGFLSDPMHDDKSANSLTAEVFRIALASLEAEPVAFVMADDLKDSSIISTPAYRDLGEAMERTVGDVVALYAIHPAQASLDAGDKLSNFIASQELLGKDLEKVLAENIEGLYVPGNSAPPAPVSVPEEMDIMTCHLDGVTETYAEGWNACRAALLHGAENAESRCSNSPVIQDGWVACSERMPEETQPVITVSEGGVVQRTVYQFCEGVWSDWYDLYNDVSADSFTHWMPLPAAPRQETE